MLQKLYPNRYRDKQEIGGHAVWTLSSVKQGFGVEQLRDHNIETFWQSDGIQPHFINIQFFKKSTIQEIAFYSEFKQDESYTPHKLSIRAGTTYHDLKEIKTFESEEPSGWITIPLHHPLSPGKPLKTNFIQICILTNHQNGRDSHIRQIEIYGPSKNIASCLDSPEFHSSEFLMYDSVR